MSTEVTSTTPAVRLIPSTRFLLALLVSTALFVQYAQRLSLSMAIVCMVDKTNLTVPSMSTNDLISMNTTLKNIPIKYGSKFIADRQFRWTEFQQQILLGAYWFGYIFTLVPSNVNEIASLD
jgi:hypothetical protein